MSRIMETLVEIAADQHGLLTIDQARQRGVSPGSVRTLAARDQLERRSQGLYRVRALPFGPDAELMEAVLWTGGRGVIVGESALALWELADANPRRVHLGLPMGNRVRRADADRFFIRHIDDLARDRDVHRGIPTLTPRRALEDFILSGLSADLALQGIETGRRRGLIGERSVADLRVRLDSRGRTGDRLPV